MSMGKGSIYSGSLKQKLNTTSSTEAEVVATHNFLRQVLWSKNFLEEQGYTIMDNIIYQDNQSAMLLEANGRASSGKRTRHMDIRHFFVTDRVHQGDVSIIYCPTDDMIADVLTKPLQGSKFRKFRKLLLNLEDD